MDLNSLASQFASLAGVAALITVVINIFKTFGIVKDGTAQTWSIILNLVGLIVLVYLRVFQPNVDIAGVDQQADSLANILIGILGFVVQIGSSKGTHSLLSGVPLVGKSNSAVIIDATLKPAE